MPQSHCENCPYPHSCIIRTLSSQKSRHAHYSLFILSSDTLTPLHFYHQWIHGLQVKGQRYKSGYRYGDNRRQVNSHGSLMVASQVGPALSPHLGLAPTEWAPGHLLLVTCQHLETKIQVLECHLVGIHVMYDPLLLIAPLGVFKLCSNSASISSLNIDATSC